MDLTASSDNQPTLEEVQARFEQWHSSRGKGRPIPAALWKAASLLYPAYSLHRIARTLCLNHTKLKCFVEGPSPDMTVAAGEAFIELGSASVGRDRQCVVEMRHFNGSRTKTKAILWVYPNQR